MKENEFRSWSPVSSAIAFIEERRRSNFPTMTENVDTSTHSRTGEEEKRREKVSTWLSRCELDVWGLKVCRVEAAVVDSKLTKQQIGNICDFSLENSKENGMKNLPRAPDTRLQEQTVPLKSHSEIMIVTSENLWQLPGTIWSCLFFFCPLWRYIEIIHRCRGIFSYSKISRPLKKAK